MATQYIQLNPNQRSSEAVRFENGLRRRIVGQEDAVRSVVDVFQVVLAKLNTPGRPLANLLFLGPTGSGKTRTIEATAEVLYGDVHAMIKVDCAEFQHSHEISKLIGSPPGYIGHRETHPLLTQEALDRYHTADAKISLVLFDEIEKASDALWQLLLGILDKATLTLGDNRRLDLSQAMIFMTSNLGGKEIMGLMSRQFGFAPQAPQDANLDQKIEKTATEAARRRFAPELINRLDKIVVFHPLCSAQLERICEIELANVQERVTNTGRLGLQFKVTRPAKAFLMREGSDIKYGARHLKRIIEQHVTCPLASLMATDQLCRGDIILIDWHEKENSLRFSKSQGEERRAKAQSAAASSTFRITKAAGALLRTQDAEVMK